MSIVNYSKAAKAEQRAFRTVLSTYFPDNRFKNPRILNICCGPITEEPVLLDYFGSSTKVLSIDKDPQFKEIAKELGRKSFKLGDLSNLEKLVRGRFDLVLGRNIPLNPNNGTRNEIYQDPWPEIFTKLTKVMHEESLMFITVCREDEYIRAKQILNSTGYYIKINEENNVVVPSDMLGVAGADVKDNYVISALVRNVS
jgi:SAM-dependent methyltransferase